MRSIERLITGVCLGGSIVAGFEHLPQWLPMTPLCFAGLLIAEDRAVRQRMGARTWPSVGYARFLFGTNLYLAVRNTLLSAAIFGIASMASAFIRA